MEIALLILYVITQYGHCSLVTIMLHSKKDVDGINRIDFLRDKFVSKVSPFEFWVLKTTIHGLEFIMKSPWFFTQDR